ncbi:hypothetical protein CSKR_109547 [Clonorchis sinensis]|uniref:Uncharacterized protein n=1 Tax=Clonorchis sinensis TaxID=79923 RepID=A0A419PQX5_CLOSI|nr:hypothetical protein CSKR_109547 [Clonorchis sinensis]
MSPGEEGWDTARLPKLRQRKSRGRGRFRTTDLPCFSLILFNFNQSINQFISYKPCTISTLVPAATVSITGKRECGTYNEVLEAKSRGPHPGRRQLPTRLSLLVSAFVLRCQVIHCPPLGRFHSAEGWAKRALRGRRSSGMRITCPNQRNL